MLLCDLWRVFKVQLMKLDCFFDNWEVVLGIVSERSVLHEIAVLKHFRINLCLLSQVVDLDGLPHLSYLLGAFASVAVVCMVPALIDRDCDHVKAVALPVGAQVDAVSVAEAGTNLLGALRLELLLGRAVHEANTRIVI